MSSQSAAEANSETVAAARAGSEDAWRELFDEHYPRLYRFFRSRVSTEQAADDLASETFLEAYRGINRFRLRQRPFGAWLFGIARNRLRMHYRSRKLTEELPDDIEHVQDDYLDVEIRDLLDQLPNDYRLAIEYRYVLGLSGQEAAALMGRSNGAFRALLLRATRAFKAEFKRDDSAANEADR